MIENQEFIQEFVEEAKLHIDKLEELMVKAEHGKSDINSVNEVFRLVHSIKGTAAFFGLTNIVSLSHGMENVFGEIRNGSIVINEFITDTILKSIDCLKEMVNDVFNSKDVEIGELLKLLNTILEKNEEVEDIFNYALRHGHKVYKIILNSENENTDKEKIIGIVEGLKEFGQVGKISINEKAIDSFDDIKSEKNIAGIVEVIFSTVLENNMISDEFGIKSSSIKELAVNEKPKEIVEFKKSEDFLDDFHKETINVDDKINIEAKTNSSQINKVKIDDSIRVNIKIINELMAMASELVLGRNQLLRTLEDHKKSIVGLTPILQNIDRLTSGMQQKIMQTRMQPIGNIFNRFPRILRDMSKELEKEINLIIEGKEVELDKSMIEALMDPITHLVRNSADHGIEKAHVREAIGKKRQGSIFLRAFHEGGFVNIDIIDDGAGMDIQKIKDKVLEKELLTEDELNKLSDQEVLKLIFKAGFSTSDKVTGISGRGVGMDVVKTNIEKLGGVIEIHTNKGYGTTVRMILPMTLAIIQSMIVEIEGHKFALPQVNLQEVVRIKRGDPFRKIEKVNGADVLRLRGTLLPIVYLRDVLKMNTVGTSTASDESIIIVLKIGMLKFGITVNSIIGSEETLVKPLPAVLSNCDFYSGVTIMGDGKIAMILDPDGIVRTAELRSSELDMTDTRLREKDNDYTEEYQNLLIFKGSGKECFALDMSTIARVDEIEDSDIEHVGDKQFIKYHDGVLRIIRLEDYLPLSSTELKQKKLYVLVPKLVRRPIGILVEGIIDNVNVLVKLNSQDINTKGILGSTILNGRNILMIHLYELLELVDPINYPKVVSEKVSDGLNLLFAEDTPFFQDVVSKYLTEAGYNVTQVKNGKIAWELLNTKKYDIVVTDIHMPEMNGIELVRKIRETPSLSNLPVIALTSMNGELQQKYAMESGFDSYEFKLDRESLIEKLNKTIKIKRGS